MFGNLINDPRKSSGHYFAIFFFFDNLNLDIYTDIQTYICAKLFNNI